jgi:hypothetical protein
MGVLQFCHGIVFCHKQNKEKKNFISWVLYSLTLQEGDDYLLLSAHMEKYTEWVFFNFVTVFFIVINKNIHTQKYHQDICLPATALSRSMSECRPREGRRL